MSRTLSRVALSRKPVSSAFFFFSFFFFFCKRRPYFTSFAFNFVSSNFRHITLFFNYSLPPNPEAYAEKHNIPVSYGTYDELLDDKDIDAIYLPVPTAMRTEWAIKAMDKGKHVLIEKPAASNAGEVESLIEAARRNNVVFMDGTMFMHNPRTHELVSRVRKGDFGTLTRVDASLLIPGSADFLANDIRTKTELEPLGAIGDVGWYTVRMILIAFNFEVPKRVSTRIHEEVNGANIDASGTIEFAPQTHDNSTGSARIGEFHCSFTHKWLCQADLLASKASIHMDDFMLANPKV